LRATSFHNRKARASAGAVLQLRYSIGSMSPFGPRQIAAAVLAAAVAIGVYLIAHSWAAATASFVGGIAVALLSADPVDLPVPTPRAADLEPPPPAPHLAAVLDAIVEPVLVVEAGRVSLANSAARGLLGQHIVGEDARLAIRHPAAQERLAGESDDNGEPINLVGLGTLDQRWEMRVLPAEGFRVIHLIDQTGSYTAERMRVDFVANASHELRTPLASILGFIETLSEGGAGEEPALRDRFLKVMHDEARRMQRLIEDLISLSRIEAEKYRLPDRAVDLEDLIAEVRSELLDAGNPRCRDLALELEPGCPPVNGDRVQLSQLLHNLLGNAMKYGRPGTPIRLRLWCDEAGMVRLGVSDQGDGIAPEHLPRLTERFYRVDSGRSRALGGTGLGLAIVKHIVERHRGRLDITSTLGAGTSVTVLLPPSRGATVTKR
jgi:two-component system, OmpR family, phosphate regulon sensor histidine kinase PhoR